MTGDLIGKAQRMYDSRQFTMSYCQILWIGVSRGLLITS